MKNLACCECNHPDYINYPVATIFNIARNRAWLPERSGGGYKNDSEMKGDSRRIHYPHELVDALVFKTTFSQSSGEY